MTKSALIVKWQSVTMGLQARPNGISVHRDEDAVYEYIKKNAFLSEGHVQAPERRMAHVRVAAGGELAEALSIFASLRYVEGWQSVLHRQAIALQPFDFTRLDLNRAGIMAQAQFIAKKHENMHCRNGYRSAPNWGAFAL